MSLVLLALVLAAPPAAPVPAGDDLIGSLDAHLVAPGESLIEIARRYGVGFNEIAEANRRFDPYVPSAGAAAVIPTAWILPAASARGDVVVNLSEMRLYVTSPGRRPPITFPVGVAMDEGATPLGVMRIVDKHVLPTWYPPPAIREEDPSIPAVVPPGPDNPLGTHALRLSRRTILIHGTNRPFGVGRKVSHGCLRLYPEDIRRLFRLVKIGTRVTIVREPVKVGVREGRVYVEAHEDESVAVPPIEQALRLLRRRGLVHLVDSHKLARVVEARSGVPVNVTADVAGAVPATGRRPGEGTPSGSAGAGRGSHPRDGPLRTARAATVGAHNPGRWEASHDARGLQGQGQGTAGERRGEGEATRGRRRGEGEGAQGAGR